MIVDELKTSILNSALNGKLTMQYPGEVVEILPQKYNSDDKKIKNEKCSKNLPSNWNVGKFGKYITLISGQDLTSDRYHSEPKDESIPYLTGASNLLDGNLIINRYTERPTSIANKGSILLTCKGTIGETLILENDKVHIARQFMAIVPNEMNTKYILYFLKNSIIELNKNAKSIIPGIDREFVLNLDLPIPPIEEQQRIVDKIDELFAKLDEIKPIEEELITIKENFPKEMKKSILVYAMQGKLSVPKINDTPVDVQLKKIEYKKEQFNLLNKIKNNNRKDHDYKYFTDDNYNIPEKWKYVPLSDACLSIFSGKSPVYSKQKNNNFILGQKVNQEDGLHFDDLKYGIDEFVKSIPKYQFLIKNDVLLNTLGGGSVGRCGIYDIDKQNVATDGHIFVIRTAGFTNEKYILYFLRLYREKLENYANGTTNQKFFNIKQIEDIMIPLPPIEEQRRIVDKIEELLSFCNDIEKLI